MNTKLLTPIVQEITIDAPASAIFDALTDPNQVTQWWGGDVYTISKMESDLRVGGRWRSEGYHADGLFSVQGEYRVIDPPRTLEYTWVYHWGGPDSTETLVRYDLMERNGSTNVRVTHSGFVDQEDHEDHDKGWVQVLAWLRDYATSSRK